MKTSTMVAVLLIVGAVLSSGGRAHAQEEALSGDAGVFYGALSPYGNWVHLSEFGWVWRPTAGVTPDWRPYTDGRWVWTDDYGWYWVAYEPWGWAPFHYGRWAFDGAYGWVWIPGTVWAPAWVEWRYSAAFVGWCALGPTAIIVNRAYYGGPATVRHDHWVYVETRHFGDSRQHDHYVPADGNGHAYQATSGNHEYRGHGSESYFAGPSRAEVERSSGHTITAAKTADARSATGATSGGSGATIRMYRPAFKHKAQVILPQATAAKLPASARTAVTTKVAMPQRPGASVQKMIAPRKPAPAQKVLPKPSVSPAKPAPRAVPRPTVSSGSKR